MEAAGRWLRLALSATLVSLSHHEDPTSCPSANFHLLEDASEVIFANVSAFSKGLLLWKWNHTSSDWQEILLITEGQIGPVDTAFTNCFYISGNDLAIQKASKALTGCYKLTYGLKEICVHHFCLEILGSKPTNLIGIIILVVVVVVVVIVVIAAAIGIYIQKKKKKQKESATENEYL